jgi:hypothetical protein
VIGSIDGVSIKETTARLKDYLYTTMTVLVTPCRNWMARSAASLPRCLGCQWSACDPESSEPGIPRSAISSPFNLCTRMKDTYALR